MVFEKSTKPEVVNVLCSNLARASSFIQEGNFLFQKMPTFVCLPVFGRLGCFATDFCCVVNNFM